MGVLPPVDALPVGAFAVEAALAAPALDTADGTAVGLPDMSTLGVAAGLVAFADAPEADDEEGVDEAPDEAVETALEAGDPATGEAPPGAAPTLEGAAEPMLEEVDDPTDDPVTGLGWASDALTAGDGVSVGRASAEPGPVAFGSTAFAFDVEDGAGEPPTDDEADEGPTEPEEETADGGDDGAATAPATEVAARPPGWFVAATPTSAPPSAEPNDGSDAAAGRAEDEYFTSVRPLPEEAGFGPAAEEDAGGSLSAAALSVAALLYPAAFAAPSLAWPGTASLAARLVLSSSLTLSIFSALRSMVWPRVVFGFERRGRWVIASAPFLPGPAPCPAEGPSKGYAPRAVAYSSFIRAGRASVERSHRPTRLAQPFEKLFDRRLG